MVFHRWTTLIRLSSLRNCIIILLITRSMILPQHILKRGWKFFLVIYSSHKKQSTFLQCILVEKEENKNKEKNRSAALKIRTERVETAKTWKNLSLNKGSARAGSWKWVSMPFQRAVLLVCMATLAIVPGSVLPLQNTQKELTDVITGFKISFFYSLHLYKEGLIHEKHSGQLVIC